MSKVTMPEPEAFLYVNGEHRGVSLNFRSDMELSDGTVRHALITTDQAEAYADARVREPQQWQPIETAPQDGTPVLLFARLESAEASTRVVGSFILGEWLAQSYIGQNKAVLVPSHWMPLPTFPPLPDPASMAKETK